MRTEGREATSRNPGGKEDCKMLYELRKEVCEANLALPAAGLVVCTTGNVSGIERCAGLVVIKPSGVDYAHLKPEDLVVVDLEGNIVEGPLKPSVDTPHHLHIYRHMEEVGGVTHTHSPCATMFATLCLPVPVYNTTHADTFGTEVPCSAYIDNQKDAIGKAIIKTARPGCSAVLLGRHGPFTFDSNPAAAVCAAITLEYAAMLAKGALELARTMGMDLAAMPDEEARKWYARHHGGIAGVTYGQEERRKAGHR